jgi:hypothetical protein
MNKSPREEVLDEANQIFLFLQARARKGSSKGTLIAALLTCLVNTIERILPKLKPADRRNYKFLRDSILEFEERGKPTKES